MTEEDTYHVSVEADVTVTPDSESPPPDPTPPVSIPSRPPPAGGYMPMRPDGDFPVPAGQFASLPDDQAAASMVIRSSWEPRPENTPANLMSAPAGYVTPNLQAYPKKVWDRVTGRCPLPDPTTDELIQWVAAKWGLGDDLIRAQLVQESHWHQDQKDAAGVPVFAAGYGDYGSMGSPDMDPARQYNKSLGGTLIDPKRPHGPESFGISQCKWWSFRPNPPGTGFGHYPWSELSTGYALDFYAAVLRAQYEGWNQWQHGGYDTYKANPGGSVGVWGAVGNWFSGGWYSTSADSYVANVQQFLTSQPWLAPGF